MNDTHAGQLKQLFDTILSQRGVTITYRQRGIVVENVPAIPSRTRLSNEKGINSRAKFGAREYTVEFGQLTWNGEQVIPKTGDFITEGDVVYEVKENETQQCYRPKDSLGMYVQIFVQKTGKTVSALPPPEGCMHVPMSKSNVDKLVDNVASRVFGEADGNNRLVPMSEEAINNLVDGVVSRVLT